jgi:hypothetical protein
MKVRYQETREVMHRTNQFKLSLKSGLELSLFNGLVDTLVDLGLNLVVDAIDNVVSDELLESGHGRIGLEHVADDLHDDFHGRLGDNKLDSLVNAFVDDASDHSVNDFFVVVHASRRSARTLRVGTKGLTL